ncbi:uncharacterized protein LOC117302767 [Asterias rubens]|uniref:uncharacterized protein LOC117302767 n=1 Tax=Asterias rubens TaxID=7604 RepID=UPI0014557922|nr:uncharacterized protein LOC117302767 [Asterias rubens]
MASTDWRTTSASVSTEHVPISFTSTTPPELWETEHVTTDNVAVNTTTEDIITLEHTTSTRGVTNETQFDEQWSTSQTTILGNNTFHQSSNLSTTTLTTEGADENFTTPQDFGGRSVFTSSVVTATFSEILNETDVAPTTNSMTAYDEFKLALFVTLSIVIGCFAITAISLRIRSKFKKRKQGAEESKKRRPREESSPKEGKPPVRRVTIKMGRRTSCSAKNTTKPLRRSHSPSLQSRARIPKVHVENSLDRNRTLDALLDAGTYPSQNNSFPPGVRQHRTNSDLSSSKTKLLAKNLSHDANEHAYDNPAISLIEEIPTETSVLSEENRIPLGLTSDVDVHHSNLVAMTRDDSESDDASLEEKSTCIESSETESLSDAKKRFKLNQYFGMRSNQRNDSKDSGYVESFISQDSLRLRAMASLEEGRPLADDRMFSHNHDRIMSRLGSIDPGLFMASVDETSASINLNRSSSVKSEYQERFISPSSISVDGVMGIRRSRYSVPSYPSQNPYYFQRNAPNSRSPYHETYSTPYMPYQTSLRHYQSSDSSVYDCYSTQSDYGSMKRKHSHGSRVLPKSLSYDMALHNYHQASTSPRRNGSYQECAMNRRAKRFVKRRSLGTQTADPDLSQDSTVKSLVQWDYDSLGNLVAKRIEGQEMDFIGPVYMAEELQEPNRQNANCVIEIDGSIDTSV